MRINNKDYSGDYRSILAEKGIKKENFVAAVAENKSLRQSEPKLIFLDRCGSRPIFH